MADGECVCGRGWQREHVAPCKYIFRVCMRVQNGPTTSAVPFVYRSARMGRHEHPSMAVAMAPPVVAAATVV